MILNKKNGIKTIKIIMLFVIFSFENPSFGQTTISRNADLRFIGKVKGEYYSDPKNMLHDFTLSIEWWTLLAEPIELYNIKWNSTGHYKIDLEGQTVEINRRAVSKYPDLLKRFDNLKPLNIDLILYGHANGEKSSVKRGSSFSHSDYYKKGSTYKKDGQSYDPYILSADIVYKVSDHKLLLSKSGNVGRGLVPGSPEVWNYFWGWKQRTSNNLEPNSEINYLVLNKSESEYKSLSKTKQAALNKQLKHLYFNTLSVSIKVEIENLEWPEVEMRSIAKLFHDYETGKKEPSPLEEVEAAEEKIEKVKEYKKDDFWSDIEKVEKPYPVAFEEGGKWGVKYNNSNTVIIPAKYYSVTVKTYCIVARISDGELCDSDYKLNNKILFDREGNLIISEPFAEYLSTDNVYDPSYYDGKLSVIQLSRVFTSKYTTKSYAKKNNLKWVPWTGKCNFYKLSKDLEVIHHFKSDKEYRWGYYRLPCDPDR